MGTNQTYLIGFFIGLLVIGLIGALMKSFMKMILSCVVVFVIYKFCFVGGLCLNDKFHINQTLNSATTTNQPTVQQQYEDYNRTAQKDLPPEMKGFNSTVNDVLKEADKNKLFNELKETLSPKNIMEKVKGQK